jgi:hypothetical protein
MNDSGNSKNATPSGQDGDGVRITEHGTSGSRLVMLYKLFALILVVCFVAFLLMKWVDRSKSEYDNARADQSVTDKSVADPNDIALSSSEATSNLPDDKITARPAKSETSRDPNDLANYIAPGQTPKMEEVIERLHDAGIHTGLGAFNPPGTSPPMIGLAVPDDYVLPEGYVRHFQATDDGQRIEPILMFSPDFDFVDSAGQRIAIPENRVVPSDMAPPGLVIRPIEIPRPLEPGGP